MKFFLHIQKVNLNYEPGKHTLAEVQEPLHDTNEGSEFLDDAIRIKDQPLTHTEECIAPGSPENLL